MLEGIQFAEGSRAAHHCFALHQNRTTSGIRRFPALPYCIGIRVIVEFGWPSIGSLFMDVGYNCPTDQRKHDKPKK
jgi:hypothetical protein